MTQRVQFAYCKRHTSNINTGRVKTNVSCESVTGEACDVSARDKANTTHTVYSSGANKTQLCVQISLVKKLSYVERHTTASNPYILIQESPSMELRCSGAVLQARMITYTYVYSTRTIGHVQKEEEQLLSGSCRLSTFLCWFPCTVCLSLTPDRRCFLPVHPSKDMCSSVNRNTF